MSSATSVQDMVRPGSVMDIYYYDADTSKKQAFPVTQNTKYVQSFANTVGGSSVFTIPPNNGIQDIICTLVMPTIADASGLALPRGWGYALIKQVSYRYGGSSQYFLTGDQLLQNAMRRQISRPSVDDILTLGGNEAVGNADFNSTKQTAYVVLTLPHNIPSAVNKANPLPTDLLTQQCQVTVELNQISSVFTVQGSPVKTPPSALDSATFQVQQVMLNNQSDALARRVDMAENAYAMPVEFVQQVQRFPLLNQADTQTISLTGFRSGEVKAIHCWLTRNSDVGTGSTRLVNPFRWYKPDSVVMNYAGDIYARYENGTSQLWNLINGNKTPVFDYVVLGSGGAYSITETAESEGWVELPFAQTFEGEGQMNTLVHGKPITNGIVSLDILPPSQQSDWVLNVSYLYNATLLFSQGTCDYVF